MPPWAGLACQQWRAILERLEQEAPDSLVTTLDWAIKLAVFKDRVGRRGIKWDTFSRRSPGREGQALRAELFEVDTRFGQFDTGIFTALDRAGVLHHHAPGVENIEHAMDNPPAVGRARVRGELVKRFVGCNGRYTCDWHGLWDLRAKQFLDLSDPFGTTQKWGPMPAEQETQHLDFQTRMRERSQALGSCPANRDLDKVMALYEQGCFEKAFRLLQSLERQLPGLSAGQRESYWRRKAWVQCRRGFLDARDCLQEIGRNRSPTMSDIVDYLYVLRFQGLAPGAEMNDWIRCGLDSAQRLESNPLPPGFHEHRGNLLLFTGQAGEAAGLLELAVAGYGRQTKPRLLARSLAALADAQRILGQDAEAVRLLDQAEQIQETHRYLADLAGFTRTNRAKLIAQTGRDLERAKTMLKRAKMSQALRGDRLGLGRTLLLEARFPGRVALSERRREAVLQLKSQLPALDGCRLLAKILARWDEWTSHPTSAEHGDIFWGL